MSRKVITFCDKCMFFLVKNKDRDSYACSITGQSLHWFDRGCSVYEEVAEPSGKTFEQKLAEEIAASKMLSSGKEEKKEEQEERVCKFIKCKTCSRYKHPIMNGDKVIGYPQPCCMCKSADKYRKK